MRKTHSWKKWTGSFSHRPGLYGTEFRLWSGNRVEEVQTHLIHTAFEKGVTFFDTCGNLWPLHQ
jgi:aryl-alcohol dehydrogenase-like predicted oxidoreductase